MSSPGASSNPTPRDSARQLQAEDFVTLILRLQRELTQLRRDVAQNSRSLSWTIATPTFPATTVAVTNTNPKAVTVYIGGGTISTVTIAGTAMGNIGGTYRVNPGDSIAIAYTGTPAWLWYSD